MIEEIYEPLSLYRDLLRERHARKTANYFEELVKRAGIDAPANAATVAALDEIDRTTAQTETRAARWSKLRLAAWLLSAIAIITTLWQGFNLFGDTPALTHLLTGLTALITAILTLQASRKRITPRIRELQKQLATLATERDAQQQEAEAQMAGLNALYDWYTTPNLIKRTVPRLELDPYFSVARLAELHHSFGWNDDFNRHKSVLYAQSGTLNGNPFVIAETLDFQMGAKTYQGSLQISWRELQHYTDSQGRPRTRYITRYQTLYAEVVKPAPEHTRNKFVIYGNEAAPTLTFSRTPSELSHLGDGRWAKLRKARAEKRLEKLSRNLDDDSGFTIMSNREFDTLFHATDRSDEVQFRLLFTPLAQEQMVALLKDQEIGYGDNFTFIKAQKINLIYPDHLAGIDLSAPPELFHSHNLEAARSLFNDYNNSWFKALYFALAPLLTIPLYQQHRSHATIYRDTYGQTPAFWEHEALANLQGSATFAHPQSVTPNLLKTRVAATSEEVEQLQVTAYGFRTESRTDYVAKMGGDGRLHQVPVHWQEYLPVSRTSPLAVLPTKDLTLQQFKTGLYDSSEWRNFFTRWQADPQRAVLRRSLLAFNPAAQTSS